MLRKIGQNYQIALPRAIVKNLGLHINDYIEIKIHGHSVILEPQVMVPKDQAYFYTPEWQKDEKAAQADIEAGRTTKTKNTSELFDKLDN